MRSGSGFYHDFVKMVVQESLHSVRLHQEDILEILDKKLPIGILRWTNYCWLTFKVSCPGLLIIINAFSKLRGAHLHILFGNGCTDFHENW